jgi:hypothetical protein
MAGGFTVQQRKSLSAPITKIYAGRFSAAGALGGEPPNMTLVMTVTAVSGIKDSQLLKVIIVILITYKEIKTNRFC